MSTAMIAGLALQGASLAVLFARLRGQWLRHLGAIFIVLACTYHGLGEILMALFPGQSPYRRYLTEMQVENFVLAVSGAIMLLTLVYVALAKPAPAEQEVDRDELRGVLDWRLLILVAAPLAAWTLRGVGVVASSGYLGADTYTQRTATSGLSDQFLLIALATTSVALILRFGPKALLPALLGQSLILAAAGQRNEVVVGVILFLYATYRVGTTLTRRSLRGLAVVGLLVFLVMTSVRANVGRDPFAGGEGFTGRADAIATGVTQIANKETRDELTLTAGYRLDGNSFGALELAAIQEGHPPLGFDPIVNNIKLAVPSVVNPGKLNTPLAERSEKYLAQARLGLPVTDILVTQLGGTVGYFGLWSLLLAGALIGFLLARLDAFLSGPVTPARLLLGIGALNALAHYGQGFEAWTLTARGVIPLVALVWVAQLVRRNYARRVGSGRVGQSMQRDTRALTLRPRG